MKGGRTVSREEEHCHSLVMNDVIAAQGRTGTFHPALTCSSKEGNHILLKSSVIELSLIL
jgi:hypothetical protein